VNVCKTKVFLRPPTSVMACGGSSGEGEVVGSKGFWRSDPGCNVKKIGIDPKLSVGKKWGKKWDPSCDVCVVRLGGVGGEEKHKTKWII